jgi:hypothetical protein
MSSPAKQALLVLMLVLGGCNGTVTLIPGMEAGAPEASTEGGGEAAANDAPKSEVTMPSDATDGGTTSDASDAVAEVAPTTDGAETEGGGQ